MKYILILILCLPALAQQGAQGVVIQFASQTSEDSQKASWLGFDWHLVTVCNTTAEPRNFHAAIVHNAAIARGIRPASYSLLQRRLAAQNRTSTARKVLLVAEVGGSGLSLLAASEAIWKPAAPWQKALPVIGSGAIRMATTLTAKHAPPEEKLPKDLLPVWVNLPAGAGACVEHTMPAISNAQIDRRSAR